MRKTKVLHVVANLRHGGVQTWILELSSQAAAHSMSMDILAYSDEEWPLSSKFEMRGVKIFSCVSHRNPVKLLKKISMLNERHGPYNAIHCHEMFHNGTLVLIGKLLGIPVRISHAHNSSQAVRNTLFRRIYNTTMKSLIRIFSTKMLAVSNMAGEKLYGRSWITDTKCKKVACGLDFSPYYTPVDRREVLKELDIPADARVIGHVGRFVDQKNHGCVLTSAAEAMRSDASIWLLLIGDGPLKPAMVKHAEALGISHRVTFTGARSDVPRIMMGAFDVLLLPSKYEGLGLVILEALAAGKPCVISNVVPPDVDIVPAMITRVPLKAEAAAWGAGVLAALNAGVHNRDEIINILSQSEFSVSNSFDAMRLIYESP